MKDRRKKNSPITEKAKREPFWDPLCTGSRGRIARKKTELPNLGFVSHPTPWVDLQKNLARNKSFSPCFPGSPDCDELSGLTWFPKKKSIARLVRSVWPFELLTEGAKRCGNKLLNSPHGGRKMRHLCRDQQPRVFIVVNFIFKKKRVPSVRKNIDKSIRS